MINYKTNSSTMSLSRKTSSCSLSALLSMFTSSNVLLCRWMSSDGQTHVGPVMWPALHQAALPVHRGGLDCGTINCIKSRQLVSFTCLVTSWFSTPAEDRTHRLVCTATKWTHFTLHQVVKQAILSLGRPYQDRCLNCNNNYWTLDLPSTEARKPGKMS